MTPRTALFFAVTLIACPAAHCEQPYDVLFDYHGNTATVSGPNPASEHYTFGQISIPNTVEYNGNTYTVTDIHPSAFQGWTDLVHIDIPSTVTTIPDSAFFGCINFRTIYCSTTLTTIGNDAFRGCSSLSAFTLPAHTPLTTIGANAFRECSSLTTFSLPDNVPLHTIGAGAFEGCLNLTAFTVPATVTAIQACLFKNCSNLISLTILNNQTIPSLADEALENTHSRLIVTVPDSLYTQYQSHVHWRYWLPPRYSVTARFEDEHFIVTGMERGRSSLVDLTIPSTMQLRRNATESFPVTAIADHAFEGIIALYVTIGDRITSIGAAAFKDCYSTSVTLLPTTPPSCGEDAFLRINPYCTFACPQGTEGNIFTVYHNDPFWGIFFPEPYDILFSINPSLSTAMVTAISPTSPQFVLSGTIIIPDTVQQAGRRYAITGIETSAFAGQTTLRDVTIPATVTTIGNAAFQNCSALNAVRLLGLPPTLRQQVFDGIPTSCTFTCPPENESDYRSNTDWALYFPPIYDVAVRIEGTHAVVIGPNPTSPNWTASHTITIPNSISIEQVRYPITAIDENAFANHTELSAITQTSGITTIGPSAFAGCNALSAVAIPTVVHIGERAFAGCNALSAVAIPAVVYIGEQAFADCSDLRGIAIPPVTTYIGDNAFAGCTGITFINLPAIPPNIIGNPFPNISPNAVITVAGNDDSAYRAHAQWTKYFPHIYDVTFRIDGSCAVATGLDIRSANWINNRSITVPNSVHLRGYTYPLVSIDPEAFANSATLRSVTLPSTITTIGTGAFRGCTALTDFALQSVTPPDFGSDTFDGVPPDCRFTCPDNALAAYSAHALWYLFFPTDVYNITFRIDGDIASITGRNPQIPLPANGILTPPTTVLYQRKIYTVAAIAANAFAGWTALSGILLSDVVTTIGSGAFAGCTGLENIRLPSTISAIPDGAFAGCTRITSFTCPVSTTAIGNQAFAGCTALQQVTFSANLVSIGEQAFAGCIVLATKAVLTIPAAVSAIGAAAFQGCAAVSFINLLPTTPPTLGIDAFSGIDNAVRFTGPNLSAYREHPDWAAFFPKEQPTPTDPDDPDPNDPDDPDPNNPDDPDPNDPDDPDPNDPDDPTPPTTPVDPEDPSNHYDVTFRIEKGNAIVTGLNMSAGNVLVIPDSIDHQGITYPVTAITSAAFAGHSSLTAVSLPATLEVTPSVIRPPAIGHYSFSGCTSLTSVTLRSASPPSLGVNPFAGVPAHCTFVAPESVIDAYRTNSDWRPCFPPLYDVAFRLDDATATIIGLNPDAPLWNNFAVTLDIPAAVYYGRVSYPVTVIAQEAFARQNALCALTLPPSIIHIDARAFADCPALSTVTLQSALPLPTLGTDAFAGIAEDALFTCPSELLALYRSSPIWSPYFLSDTDTPDDPDNPDAPDILILPPVNNLDSGSVTSLDPATPILLYDLSGRLLYRGSAAVLRPLSLAIPHGIYLIFTPQSAFKIRL